MKISISMITLNEEINIARALSSCTFADEIVVVDGGSTDGTLDILRSHGKVVLIQHAWEGHFGKQRQMSLDNCTGDWVVRLDADEAFSQFFEENIRTLLESTPLDITGYFIRQCNLIGNENYYSKGADDYENIPRIWRNLREVKWEGQVHEMLRVPYGWVDKHWDAYVVHYGFLDKEKLWKKSEQYSQIDKSGFNTPEELVYREYDVQFRPLRSNVSTWVPPYPSEKISELPRVAILRGPNLNLWEMQNYEPLCKSFDITSYTTNQPSFDISHITLPVVKLPPHPQNPAYMVGLEAELLDKDIIYTADITWIFTYQAAMMKQKFGKRIIALEWENIPFAYEEDEQVREMKRFNRQMVDHFVAVTERAKDALIIEGVPEDKITVIPMGIDVNRFRPDDEARWRLRKEFGIGIEERVVLFTGRMVWEKGIYDLLYAAKLVTQEESVKDVHFRFVVIGKGSESSGIKSRVEELGVGSVVTFIEGYPYHRMHEMYNMADIFVLPSISTRTWKEQFGMVLIEAMACGLPVISTLSGSIPEVVGDAGILVQSNDPRGLFTAIMKLLKDDTLNKELSIKGRERAINEFDSQKIAHKFNLLFEELVQSSFRGAVQELACYTGVYVDEVISRIKGVYAQQIKDWGGLSKGMLTQEKVNEFYINTDSYLFDLVQYNYENPMYMQGIDEITKFCRQVSSERGKLNILDFGGGIGSQIINLSRISGMQLNYADIPGKTFNYAKWRFERRGLDVNMFDASRDDFLGSNRFDVVIMLDVVEHLVEPEKTVKYLIEHINTNGYLIMFASFFNNNGEAGWHLNVERYTNEGFYNIVKEMGLEMLNSAPLRFFRKAFEESADLIAEIDAAIAEGGLAEARGFIESYLELHPLDLSTLVKYAEVCFKLSDYDTALDNLDKVLLFNKDIAGAAELKRKIESYVSYSAGEKVINDSTSHNQKGIDKAIDRDYFRQVRKEVEALVPGEAMRILDVGCGEGILGKRLLDKGAVEVVGIEVDPMVSERAKENLSRVLHGDVSSLELPFDDGYFDCIIFADVLEHLKEPLVTLRRFNRYLADSGTIIASIPNVRYYGVINMLVEGQWKYQDYGILDRTHLRFFAKKDIDSLFEEAGFEITGITANIDPLYTSLNDPLSGEISFGRMNLKGLSHEELKDLFVIQYLVKAEKSGNKKVYNALNIATDSEDLGKAIDILEGYLEEHPADTDFLYRHADICYRLGQLDKSLDSIDKLLLFEPERSDAIEFKSIISMVSSKGTTF